MSLKLWFHKVFIQKISKFSFKMFLLIILCVVLPLSGTCIYIQKSMEDLLQEKISERIIQNISRSERDIIRMLQTMSALSNTFALDEELLDRLMDGNITEFENVLYFNQIVDRMSVTTGDNFVYDTKIILFDEFDRVYSNWSLNFENYEFLLEEEWVKAAMREDGHMSWSMFSPAYITQDQKEKKNYISLARPILKFGTVGDRVGTLIMSIEQSQFSRLLMTYAYQDDIAYVCIDEGEVLLSNDEIGILENTGLKEAYRKAEGQDSGSLRQKDGNEEYLVSFYTIPKPWLFDGKNMKVFHFTNYQGVVLEVASLTGDMNRFILLAVFGVMVLAYVSVRMLVKPIVDLTDKMGKYTLDSEITGIDIERKDEIGHLNQAFIGMSDNIRKLFAKLNEESRIKEQYRYESLRAQLNPHFLFNTLTSIRWMAMIRGADNIVKSIDALAHVLKYSLSYDHEFVTLKDELDNIRNFVYIHNIRYQDHCILETELSEDMMELKMMKFILQPIVENAIIHGMEKDRGKLTVRIYGYTEEEVLYLFVEDNGVGITQEEIERFESSRQEENKGSKMTGIGLKNVDTCIRITFGEQYGLTLQGGRHKGTVVSYKLPVIGEEDKDEENHDCG